MTKQLEIKLKRYIMGDRTRTARKNLEIFETKHEANYGPIIIPIEWKAINNHPQSWGKLNTKSLVMWLAENGIYQFRFGNNIRVIDNKYYIEVYFTNEASALAAKIYWS